MTFSFGSRILCISAAWVLMAACTPVGIQKGPEPTALRLSPDSLILYVPGEEGDEARFPSSSRVTLSVFDGAGNPIDGEGLELRWEVSDRQVVSVEPTGRLTALSTGTATVRAASAANNTLAATMSVSVLDRGGAEVVVK